MWKVLTIYKMHALNISQVIKCIKGHCSVNIFVNHVDNFNNTNVFFNNQIRHANLTPNHNNGKTKQTIIMFHKDCRQ
jgi:hypothetical protein